MMPSLRAGSVQRVPASIRLWSTVEQQLAAAADRERLRGGDPQLLARVVGRALGVGEAAEDLVHEAEVAHGEEQVGDLAAVEVREVQAGAEDAPAGVARVLDDAAPQHRDLDLGVEQREVDRGLQRAGRRVVLGVEVARVAQLDGADLAGAGDRRRAEVDVAGARQLVEVLERELGRAQHRVDQVTAGLGVGEDVAEQLALGDLVAVLVLLQALALGVDDEPARRQAGDALGGRVDEVVGADARSSRRRSARRRARGCGG